MSQLLIIGISVYVLLLVGMIADRLLADKVAWQDLVWRLTLLSVLVLPLFLILANSQWPSGLVQVPVLVAEPEVAIDRESESTTGSINFDLNKEPSHVGSSSLQEPVPSSVSVTVPSQGKAVDDPNVENKPAATNELAPTNDLANKVNSPSLVSPALISNGFSWLDVVKTVWLLGSFCFLVRYIVGWATIQRIVVRAKTENKTEPPGWSHAIEQATCLAGLKSRIVVRASDRISTPMLVGAFRPVVLVPESMLQLSPSDARVQAALSHEAMHIRRADAHWNIMLFVCTLMWWPIPIVHWMKKRMFWLRELLCDAGVGTEMGAADYAESLLKLAQLPCKRRIGLPAVPMHSQQQSLESRVAWILDRSGIVPTPSRLFRRAAWFCLVVTLLGFTTIKLVPANSPPPTTIVSAVGESVQDHDQKAAGDATENEVEFHGVVKTAEGKPVSGATVHMRWNNRKNTLPCETLTATTNDEGRYTISTDLPGPYRIWAEGDGLTSLEKFLAGKGIAAQSDPSGPVVTDITIKKACDYEVTIVSAETKQVIEGAKIHFGWTDIEREYTTGTNGVASIRGLASNDWYFVVKAEGYATFFEKTSPQALGTTTDLTYELQPGATVEFTLRDQNDDPIPDAILEIQYEEIGMAPHIIPYPSKTNAEGKLIAKGIPFNTKLQLVRNKNGYRFDWSDSKFEIKEKEELIKITFVGEKLPYGGDAEFAVTDEEGVVIAGATIENPSNFSSRYHKTTTDMGGWAELNNLYSQSEHKYVIITADGMIPQRLDIKPGPKGEPKLIQVALKNGKTLKGIVLTPEGKPAPANTRVYFNEGEHGEWDGGGVSTDAEGKFEIRGLPDTATITVYTPRQYEPINDLSFDVVEGEEVKISMTPAAVLRVRAIDDATGTPIPKFNVRLGHCKARLDGDKRGIGIYSNLVNPGVNIHGTQKEFKLDHQIAGVVYEVTVSAEGYETKTINRMQTVVESEAKLIDVALTKK